MHIRWLRVVTGSSICLVFLFLLHFCFQGDFIFDWKAGQDQAILEGITELGDSKFCSVFELLRCFSWLKICVVVFQIFSACWREGEFWIQCSPVASYEQMFIEFLVLFVSLLPPPFVALALHLRALQGMMQSGKGRGLFELSLSLAYFLGNIRRVIDIQRDGCKDRQPVGLFRCPSWRCSI